MRLSIDKNGAYIYKGLTADAKINSLITQLELLRNELRKLRTMYKEASNTANRARDLECAWQDAKARIEILNATLKEKEAELDSITSAVDTRFEKSIVSEMDVSELNRKIEIKKGLLRQLRGHFLWRQNSEKKRAYILSDMEIANIMKIINESLEG